MDIQKITLNKQEATRVHAYFSTIYSDKLKVPSRDISNHEDILKHTHQGQMLKEMLDDLKVIIDDEEDERHVLT